MVLERIIEHKRGEVEARKRARSLASLKDGLEPSTRGFEQALRAPGTRYIFECKKASPSRGLIRPDFDPIDIARSYAPYADAISVLIDNRFFSGRIEYLTQVSETVPHPVLAKDFILEPYQIFEARAHGADAVLLMFSVLDDTALVACREAADSLGMGVLAEVHDSAELERASALDFPVIGINNRNLKTLEVDLSVTERLAPRAPAGRVLVAESGVSTHGELRRLADLVDAFLIGSAPMAEPDIDEACKKIVYGPVKVCGLTRVRDAEAAKRLGAVYGGLIFVKKSPRFIEPEAARAVRNAVDLRWVGVFVNEDLERVAALAEELDLSAVQLHGDETPAYISSLRERIGGKREIWKAFRVKDRLPDIDGFGADRCLLDTFKSGARGGTGTSFDWSLLQGRDMGKIILSGGLNPDNVLNADEIGACALDLNSGVETDPGIKSEVLLGQVFDALRGRKRRSE